MAIYSFQERFISWILDLSKRHTIRKKRKYPPKPGDKIYLYFGLRTKWCKKIGEATCDSTKEIIFTEMGNVFINGKRLNQSQKDFLAWMDGFRPALSSALNPIGSFKMMFRFWKVHHQLPFTGEITYWRNFIPDQKMQTNGKRKTVSRMV